MATKATIEMNYRQALKQAEKLDTIANNIKHLSGTELRGSLQNISANWKGDNASLYLNKGSRLQETMNKTAGELHSVASDIRTIAKRVRDADIAALAIAAARNYS